MKLYVKNKEEAEFENNLNEPHVIISINYPKISGEKKANPIVNENTKEVLFLYFSDVGRLSYPINETIGLNSRCIPFNRDMAKEVIDLIDRNKVEHIIIHCLMGISRSASMADAISMYFNLKKATNWIVINELVYTTMLKELIRKYG